MPTLGDFYGGFYRIDRRRPVNQGKGRGITKPAVRRRKRRR